MEERTKIIILALVIILLVIVALIIITLLILFRPKTKNFFPFRDKDILLIHSEGWGYLTYCQNLNQITYPTTTPTTTINNSFYWQVRVDDKNNRFQLNNLELIKENSRSLLTVNSVDNLVINNDSGGLNSWFSLEVQGNFLYKVKSLYNHRYWKVENSMFYCSENYLNLGSEDEANIFNFRISLPS